VKILVTGPPISGKSGLRRSIIENLRASGYQADHYDVDRFDHLRDRRDTDCIDTPDCRQGHLVVEDVHAFCANAVAPLDSYDAVLYTMPDTITGLRCLLTRAVAWFNKGLFDFDRERGGWRGNGIPRDWRNILPIATTAAKTLIKRQNHFNEDKLVLQQYRGRLIVVRPRFKRGELTFPCVTDLFAVQSNKD
jgi:hypothetical protein